MCVRFKENKEIGVSLENDLNEYKRTCIQLYERVESLEKDNGKAKSVDGGICIDKLNKEIADLRHEKISADDDTKILISKFTELERQTTLHLKELDDYKVGCHSLSGELKEKEMECLGFESKLKELASITDVFRDEREGYKTALKGLKEQITSLAEDRKILCYREKKAEERISCLQEVIKTLVESNKKLTDDEGAAECFQLSRESKMCSHHDVNRDEHVSGSMSIERQSEPSVNLSGDKEKASSLFSMELENRENKEINIELEKREIALLKPDSFEPAGIIQINKNE
ncbi:hypothetical protein MKW92_037732 [Papaver armeniacum]|nr:hypothetical protein MKW92_037732 [Papaver armeniacum]